MATFTQTDTLQLISKEEIQHLAGNFGKEPKSVSMSRVRQFGFSKLARFADLTNIDLAATSLNTAKLDILLSKFYAGICKGDGTAYAHHSFKVIRYGLHCYYRDEFNYKITCRKLFPKSNRVYRAVCQRFVREATPTKVKQSPLISMADMERIQNSAALDCMTPCGLQNKVFIDIIASFSIFGKETLRSLQPSDFKLTTDENGLRCLSRIEEDASSRIGAAGDKSKLRGNEPSVKITKMYEIPNSEKCPVKSYLKLVSKLSPNCSYLWQRPRDLRPMYDSLPWYTDVAMGLHLIGSKMKEISAQASCSKMYTNFSLRAFSPSTFYGCYMLESAEKGGGMDAQFGERQAQSHTQSKASTYGLRSRTPAHQSSETTSAGTPGGSLNVGTDKPSPKINEETSAPTQRQPVKDKGTMVDREFIDAASGGTWKCFTCRKGCCATDSKISLDTVKNGVKLQNVLRQLLPLESFKSVYDSSAKPYCCWDCAHLAFEYQFARTKLSDLKDAWKKQTGRPVHVWTPTVRLKPNPSPSNEEPVTPAYEIVKGTEEQASSATGQLPVLKLKAMQPLAEHRAGAETSSEPEDRCLSTGCKHAEKLATQPLAERRADAGTQSEDKCQPTDCKHADKLKKLSVFVNQFPNTPWMRAYALRLAAEQYARQKNGQHSNFECVCPFRLFESKPTTMTSPVVENNLLQPYAKEHGDATMDHVPAEGKTQSKATSLTISSVGMKQQPNGIPGGTGQPSMRQRPSPADQVIAEKGNTQSKVNSLTTSSVGLGVQQPIARPGGTGQPSKRQRPSPADQVIEEKGNTQSKVNSLTTSSVGLGVQQPIARPGGTGQPSKRQKPSPADQVIAEKGNTQSKANSLTTSSVGLGVQQPIVRPGGTGQPSMRQRPSPTHDVIAERGKTQSKANSLAPSTVGHLFQQPNGIGLPGVAGKKFKGKGSKVDARNGQTLLNATSLTPSAVGIGMQQPLAKPGVTAQRPKKKKTSPPDHVHTVNGKAQSKPTSQAPSTNVSFSHPFTRPVITEQSSNLKRASTADHSFAVSGKALLKATSLLTSLVEGISQPPSAREWAFRKLKTRQVPENQLQSKVTTLESDAVGHSTQQPKSASRKTKSMPVVGCKDAGTDAMEVDDNYPAGTEETQIKTKDPPTAGLDNHGRLGVRREALPWQDARESEERSSFKVIQTSSDGPVEQWFSLNSKTKKSDAHKLTDVDQWNLPTGSHSVQAHPKVKVEPGIDEDFSTPVLDEDNVDDDGWILDEES